MRWPKSRQLLVRRVEVQTLLLGLLSSKERHLLLLDDQGQGKYLSKSMPFC
jgi:hypothetical protein